MNRLLFQIPDTYADESIGGFLVLIHAFAEKRMLRTAFIVSAGGVLMLFFRGTARVPSILFIVLRSTGGHLLQPVRRSISIHSAREGKQGLAMGMTTSVPNIGHVLCVSDNLAPATPWHVRIEPRAKVTVTRINLVCAT